LRALFALIYSDLSEVYELGEASGCVDQGLGIHFVLFTSFTFHFAGGESSVGFSVVDNNGQFALNAEGVALIVGVRGILKPVVNTIG